MNLDLSPLAHTSRLLFEIPLRPLQGQRFQPTGFPGLGAATFQTAGGLSLLVESAQSMANRLELTGWDEEKSDLKQELQGLSHVSVVRGAGSTSRDRENSATKEFLTDSVTEAHRLNSPYIMFGKVNGQLFFDELGERLNAFEVGPLPSRKQIAEHLIHWDIGTLLHGVFLSAKKGKDKTLAGGRLRLARALSAFIEADEARPAASGGVKNDHVNPSGDTKAGFGNVPFARDEFTADRITLYVNLDLGQIRGYGLGADVERLLTLLALYKLRVLVDGSLRLRTACDLEPATDRIEARRPASFLLPDASALAEALQPAIAACRALMTVTEVRFDDDLKKAKDSEKAEADDDQETDGE
ncbi:MAG: type I-U CRISPR-associated protein Cas7 [Immundisolibacter sp.]|uniref:type I-G CRISPR-associated RAMP protein Csb1/Cas7g n=1 Tax=Immundisolibacter sp. TaxID=1934948 RepID=UPI00199268AC|nr:type I-U CRISPR-associated RAMP protein Csb1/Cas7u [Immundisolibacter sp.]MBC7161756.1 type I-U CRISPR-associated protein Cas7 [Immundisolibacter sp.]